MKGANMERPDVLLVDDDQAIREVFQELLGRDHRVRVCSDLATAQRALQSSPPDVIVTDYYLPDGTCEEMLALAAERCPNTRRLVFTGSAVGADRLRRLELVDDAIIKPASVDELLHTIGARP
jgi:DNA-binding NtrC family response regulator